MKVGSKLKLVKQGSHLFPLDKTVTLEQIYSNGDVEARISAEDSDSRRDLHPNLVFG